MLAVLAVGAVAASTGLVGWSERSGVIASETSDEGWSEDGDSDDGDSDEGEQLPPGSAFQTFGFEWS
ncbi:hypothetical protein ACN27G_25875 [Plantactinospora sp. WMMB334]|uniref:hypothetical protein n=1 Tax=Plantactinospora sp. WMMB334 TaxID=3404119 RepID=UPI003B948118